MRIAALRPTRVAPADPTDPPRPGERRTRCRRRAARSVRAPSVRHGEVREDSSGTGGLDEGSRARPRRGSARPVPRSANARATARGGWRKRPSAGKQSTEAGRNRRQAAPRETHRHPARAPALRRRHNRAPRMRRPALEGTGRRLPPPEPPARRALPLSGRHSPAAVRSPRPPERSRGSPARATDPTPTDPREVRRRRAAPLSSARRRATPRPGSRKAVPRRFPEIPSRGPRGPAPAQRERDAGAFRSFYAARVLADSRVLLRTEASRPFRRADSRQRCPKTPNGVQST